MRSTFGQIAVLTVKVLKILTWASYSLQNRKTVRFQWKLRKTLFLGHAQHVFAKSRFWPSKFSKSWNWPEILFKTEKQCAFHENCTKRSFQLMRSRFGQIAVLTVKFLKILTLAWNSHQNGKTVRFPWKLCKTLFLGHEEHVLAKSHFSPCKFSKSSQWPKILSKTGKTVRFPWKLCKTLFSGHAQHVLAKSHFWPSKFSKSSHRPKISLQKVKTVRFS